jgi:signal peptidase I
LTVYPPPETKQKSFIRDLLEIVVLALALYIVINFAVQTVHVMGTSMLPGLQDNDFLIASKVSYHLHEPERGDIVVFKPSTGGSADYIKRIIAIPKDHLRIQHAQVFINGKQLNEPYLNEKWTYLDTWNQGDEQVVPDGEYFVMGDNRNHSSDSRSIGFQRKDAFLGKAWIRIWPLGTFKVFQTSVSFQGS